MYNECNLIVIIAYHHLSCLSPAIDGNGWWKKTLIYNMDLIKDATKNINLYDVKAYVRKAQNGMYK